MAETDAGRAPRERLELNERRILEALSSLRFGMIRLTVHNNKLVQMDVTRRERFSS